MAAASERPTICYVIPSLSRDGTEHFAHLPNFLSEVSRYAEVDALVERSTGLPPLPGVNEALVLNGRTAIGRALALIRAVSYLRRRGCRTFFVRISASAAFVLTMLQRPLNLTVYYWISGEIDSPRPSHVTATEAWRARLSLTVARIMQRLAIRHAAWFVTGPRRMKEYFIRVFRLHPSRVLLLDNDIDVTGYRAFRTACDRGEARRLLGLPEDRPVVLFVGRVSFGKGGAYLPEIARRLMAVRPDAFLVVVGEVYLKGLREALRVQGLGASHLRLTGALPHRDVLPYYCAADVLIMPSVDEGFPRRLLEAMALGLPFVAFDVGGVSDIVSDTQRPCVVSRGDLAGLVNRVVELLADSTARERLREAGFERVEMYDTPRVARRFVELVSRHGT